MRWVISDVWTKFDPNRVSHADIPEIARTVECGMRFATTVALIVLTTIMIMSYQECTVPMSSRFAHMKNPSADRSRDALDIGGDDFEGPCSTLSAINADRDQSRL